MSRYRRISPPLLVERQDDGRRLLVRNFVVEVDGRRLSVPAGFLTDYSSIPQPLAWFARWSRVDCAGVVHDRLYYTGEVPRREADRAWRIIATSGRPRANWLQGAIGYLALRLAGKWAWKRHRRPASTRLRQFLEDADVYPPGGGGGQPRS